MEVVGYCTIKKDAKTGMSHLPISEFTTGMPLRVQEFATDGGVLVVNNSATGLAMFDKEDIVRSFKCKMYGDVCVPHDADMVEQMLYATKILSRKGGYNQTLKGMVILASIRSGELNDRFLFEKQ